MMQHSMDVASALLRLCELPLSSKSWRTSQQRCDPRGTDGASRPVRFCSLDRRISVDTQTPRTRCTHHEWDLPDSAVTPEAYYFQQYGGGRGPVDRSVLLQGGRGRCARPRRRPARAPLAALPVGPCWRGACRRRPPYPRTRASDPLGRSECAAAWPPTPAIGRGSCGTPRTSRSRLSRSSRVRTSGKSVSVLKSVCATAA